MTQPRELLRGPLLKGPLMSPVQSGPAQFAGRTSISSGVATVTVSTYVVKSDSLVFLTAQSITNQSSGVSKPIEVRSISDGNFFTLGWADGVGTPRTTDILWNIVNSSHH